MKKLSIIITVLAFMSCSKDETIVPSTINSKINSNAIATVTPKKGFGLTESVYGNTQLSALNLSWYYSWGYNTSISAPVATFTPMVFSLNTLSSVTPKTTILGFNEPDNSSQSNMSVATAIANWPTLVSKSTRIGSPATASNPLTTGSWLTQFMNSTPKPKVDFVCVHWYKGCNVAKFKSDMTAIINLYGKPIWITEFAPQTVSSAQASPTKYTQTEVNTFLNQVITWMETNPMIEKYAYHNPKYGTCATFTSTGALTATGITYRDAH